MEKSLTPLLANRFAEWKDASFGYFRNGISTRTNQYRVTKYFREAQPVIELYDYQKDANKTKNNANDNPVLWKV